MIVSGCLSGAVVLCDLKHLEAWRILVYAMGVLTIVLGMYVIFRQEVRQKSSLAAGSASIDVECERTISWKEGGAKARSSFACLSHESTSNDELGSNHSISQDSFSG